MLPRTEIRIAGPYDHAKLARREWMSYWRDLGPAPAFSVALLSNGSAVSAIRIFCLPDDVTGIGGVFTTPAWRGHGYAATLLGWPCTERQALYASEEIEPFYRCHGFYRWGGQLMVTKPLLDEPDTCKRLAGAHW